MRQFFYFWIPLSPFRIQQSIATRLSLSLFGLGILGLLNACSPAHVPDEQPPQREEVKLRAAKNFSVERQGDLILLGIGQAWQDAEKQYQYVLYPKNQEPPKGFSQATLIPVPVERIICTGSAQVAMLEALDATHQIVAMSNGQYLYQPELRAKLEQGEVVDLGNDQSFNYEGLLAVDPDLVFGFSIGNNQHLKKIETLGIPTVLLSEFMESSPLGRAEWMLFMSYFIGKSALAQQKMDSLVDRYQTLKKHLAQKKNPPTVFTGVAQQGAWYIAGGQSFIAQLIQDAGGQYLWAEDQNKGGVPLDFEVVLAKAEQADIWLDVVLAKNLEQLKAMDPRYSYFKAFQNQKVYSYTARISENGGYDFFESAIMRPDLVLKDLSIIFHEDTLAQKELYYYQKLP